MNCLKCPNYWRTDIDEKQCDRCGCEDTASKSETKESEGKSYEQMC